MTDTPESPDQLVLAALDLFGRYGFDGASTRAIARAAGKPMSAITYHFGGKEELYVAVARYIAGRIGTQMAPAIETAAAAREDDSPAAARAQILRIFAALVSMLVQKESAAWARFIVREQMEPTRAFDELYNGPMGPMLHHITRMLCRAASHRIGPDEARLRVIAMFGQVLVFRVSRAVVLRSNGWDDIGAAETEQIRRVILAQVDAILDSLAAKDGA
ncbi:CerR family C-terminal domain-containing protein [Flavisphingomonas formosensis]|uniref:CerR family C-terminal domain-containing protein n=1 Tax=Flavisphingomonas formosensis TaxID=861534 RepID=UPI0012F9225B|nr:CerR family C-terminal domain-containing protein [Sphingomonas formosensis]